MKLKERALRSSVDQGEPSLRQWVEEQSIIRPVHQSKDPDILAADAALRRAARRAREIGRKTDTPVYVLKNGRIVDLTKERNGNDGHALGRERADTFPAFAATATESRARKDARRMKTVYTRKQGQHLAFIHHYTRVNGQPPAEADIHGFFRVSPPSVHQMILNLEAKGLLARTPGKARSLRVLVRSGELPELTPPDATPEESRHEGEVGVRQVRARGNRKPKPARHGSPLQQLKDHEAAGLLRSLLVEHPELSAEAEALAASVIGDVAMEDVAQEAEDAVRALDIDDLNARAGSHADGYVEPAEAAWELIEEAVMPLIEDIERRLDAGQPDAAVATCAGIVLGLYRLRHDANDGCLGWAPDAPAEMAGEAVCTLRKSLRKMRVPEIAGQPCDTLPALLRGAAPEWLDMLMRWWRMPS